MTGNQAIHNIPSSFGIPFFFGYFSWVTSACFLFVIVILFQYGGKGKGEGSFPLLPPYP